MYFCELLQKEGENLGVLDRIFSMLKEQGKSQVDLADFLGLSKNNISEWKHGRNRSYEKYLYQIAAFLGTSPEYLKGETDIKTAYINGNHNIVNDSGTVNVSTGISDQERDLVELFRSLSTIDKAKALLYMAELKEKEQ